MISIHFVPEIIYEAGNVVILNVQKQNPKQDKLDDELGCRLKQLHGENIDVFKVYSGNKQVAWKRNGIFTLAFNLIILYSRML